MRYEFPYHVYAKRHSSEGIAPEGCNSLTEARHRVSSLREDMTVTDIAVVKVSEATVWRIYGVLWPFENLLQSKYGERLMRHEDEDPFASLDLTSTTESLPEIPAPAPTT
jgi:hypothetical protein